MKKDLAIIICNFNKKDYLKDSLESIQNANFEEMTKDIIVVDNASGDGSEEMVRSDFPDVILIQTGANLGGAGGFAKGMQYAIDEKYAYVAVLDNDTKVAPDTFLGLKKQLDSDNFLGVAGATILQMDFPNRIQEMGAMLNYDWFGFELNYFNYDINSSKLPSEIDCDYVPACCFMTKHEVLKKVGTFNPDFFIFFDDIDWCTRVKNTGLKVKAFRDIHVWHKGGTKLTTNTFGHYYYARNVALFFLETMPEKKLKNFVKITSNAISKLMFFGSLKKQSGPAKAAILGLNDAYGHRLGAQWHGIFPKITPKNKLYDLCKKKKNILVVDNGSVDSTTHIIQNLQNNCEAKITLLVHYSIHPKYNNVLKIILKHAQDNPKNKKLLKILNNLKNDKVHQLLSVQKSYTNQEIIETIEDETIDIIKNTVENIDILTQVPNLEEYDLVVQSVPHISKYKLYKGQAEVYLDQFSNYIIKESDKKDIKDYKIFKRSFNETIAPIIQIQCETIYKELHADK